VRRSKWLASICREHGALCIVNDRPDIARAAGADGVHVGQDELTCQDAGGLLGDHGIVGVSTHAIRQAREAVDEGAAYIGVGPVFPSATKSFDDFPGLDYLRAVSQNVDIPWFAIGGITLANVDEVIAAGAGRVAVTSAISRSPSPGEVAGEFLNRLLQVPV